MPGRKRPEVPARLSRLDQRFAAWRKTPRRRTTATLRELSGRFGLSHSHSASDLIKRGVQQAKQNRNTARKLTSIERALGLNPESQA